MVCPYILCIKRIHLSETLGEVLSAGGYRQLRIAETEKYAHVTYFFNGGEEEPFEGGGPHSRKIPSSGHL